MTENQTQTQAQSSGSKIIIAFLLFIITPIWVWIIGPELTKLPTDFEYHADIISIDNFYDPNTEEFQGEQRSVTKFSYTATEKHNGIITIENIFDVSTVSGEPIFAVERTYGIDRKKRAHVFGYGDANREGYLFAQKNLRKGKSFTYWHINYDGPAHMIFAGEEKLFGLPVYRYNTTYKDVIIDQTDNLTHLPEVGITKGVQLEPYLSIWIEPVTGRLIKYTDETTAYYYDLSSEEKLYPWNAFKNTYQRSSIIEQVKIAKKQKTLFFTIQVVIPLILIAAAIIALFINFGKRKWATCVASISILGIAGYYGTALSPSLDSEPIKIGIARWVPLGNQAYDQNIEGFKNALEENGYQEGRDIIYYPEIANSNPEKQYEIAHSFVEKDVDLVFSQTTPGTLIMKEVITKKPIVFSIVTYPEETGIIASVKNSGNNLVGTRNWVPIKKQLETFLETVPTITSIGFIHREGEQNSEIQLERMKKTAYNLGIEITEIKGENLAELTTSLKKNSNVDSLFSACDTLVQGEAEEIIIKFAHKNKIPSFSCNLTGPLKGDLVGTIADFYTIGHLAGEQAALILEGASPSSLETRTVAIPHIYVNQKTADILDITIPQSILLQAKEITK